ncbi:MAG: hypothetical protein U0163_22110 [Gemmatimonadaceae bacterium]
MNGGASRQFLVTYSADASALLWTAQGQFVVRAARGRSAEARAGAVRSPLEIWGTADRCGDRGCEEFE